MQKKPGIAVAYNGDGAVNQGAFHEVMNMAALWKLPFVCVIEDNKYAVSVTTQESTVVPAWKRAAGYDCPGEYVEGNDPDLIFEAAARAVQHARDGKGPAILEIETERLHGHFIGDSAATARRMKSPARRIRFRSTASDCWMRRCSRALTWSRSRRK